MMKLLRASMCHSYGLVHSAGHEEFYHLNILALAGALTRGQ